MINQFQLLFLLIVSGSYLSDGVFNLITGLSFTLFDFNFIKIEEINTFSQVYSYFSFQQTNIGLEKFQKNEIIIKFIGL